MNSLFIGGVWEDGYVFEYTNDSHWSLIRADGYRKTYLYEEVYSDAIKPYGWNKLAIFRDYPFIDLWINGQYVGYVNETTYDTGFVGIGMYESDAYSSALLVDKANLYNSDTPPYWWPYSEDSAAAGSRDPAYDLTATTSVMEQSENMAP